MSKIMFDGNLSYLRYDILEQRLYPYGPLYHDQSFGRTDDSSYLVYLKSPIFYINKFYRKIYVSTAKLFYAAMPYESIKAFSYSIG